MPHWQWTDDRGFEWDLQQFGPAAIPIAMAGTALFGAINQRNQQKAANAAAGDAQNHQNANLAQASGYADELAHGDYTQPIRDAGESGIKTFESVAGGVPNIGALVQSLFGDNLGHAMKAAAGQRSANLSGAISGLTGTANTYGQANRDAGAAATSGGNPWASVFAALSGLPHGGGSNTNVATGLGGMGGDNSTFAFGGPTSGNSAYD